MENPVPVSDSPATPQTEALLSAVGLLFALIMRSDNSRNRTMQDFSDAMKRVGKHRINQITDGPNSPEAQRIMEEFTHVTRSINAEVSAIR